MPGMVARTAMATFRRLSRAVPWTHAAPEAIYVATAGTPPAGERGGADRTAGQQGVRIVEPEDLSMAEQIAAFRAARLVIGAHGVGMSNIVFSQPRHFRLRTAAPPLPQHAGQSVGPVGGAELLGRHLRAALTTTMSAPGASTSTSVAARLAAISERIAVTPRGNPHWPSSSARRPRIPTTWQRASTHAGPARRASRHGQPVSEAPRRAGAAWPDCSPVAAVDGLSPIGRRQQRPHRQLRQPVRPMHDHQRIGAVVEEHLAARAARRHHGEFAIDLVGLRVTHGHHGLDRAVALEQRAAKRHRLGAHRQTADRRAEVQAGPDAAVGARIAAATVCQNGL